MQNNEHSSSGPFRTFLQEKGYYIVLVLCVLAVGVSGYLFVAGARQEKDELTEPVLSVATSAQIPGSEKSAVSKKSSSQAKPGADAGSSQASSKQASEAGQEAESSQTLSVRVWPVSGERVAEYAMQALSYNTTTRDWRTHDGVDISALVGESVKAACSGTVTAVYDDEFLGTTVVISHPEGYMSYYANLAAMPAVSAGTKVSAGDVIGAVGQSALLESGEVSHLHFAVTKNGQSIDPTQFID